MKHYKKFYQTELWQEGYEIQKKVFELATLFPKEEKYGLTSQVNRSSNSVIANLAEEHGRFYFKDKVRVLYIVRCEIQETQSHLIVAVGRGYINDSDAIIIIKKYEKLKMMINGRVTNFMKKTQKTQ